MDPINEVEKVDKFKSMKDEFIELLRSTNREGMTYVIEELTKSGFFSAPASSKYHGNYPGGLLEHSLDVYYQMKKLVEVQRNINPKIEVDDLSVIIVSLLHDVCKYNIYKIVKKWRKNSENKWEQYDTYEISHVDFPMGHGEKSVILLLKWGLKLTDDEIISIRWHMNCWDLSEYGDSKASFNAAMDHPLASILVAADWLASRISVMGR